MKFSCRNMCLCEREAKLCQGQKWDELRGKLELISTLFFSPLWLCLPGERGWCPASVWKAVVWAQLLSALNAFETSFIKIAIFFLTFSTWRLVFNCISLVEKWFYFVSFLICGVLMNQLSECRSKTNRSDSSSFHRTALGLSPFSLLCFLIVFVCLV